MEKRELKKDSDSINENIDNKISSQDILNLFLQHLTNEHNFSKEKTIDIITNIKNDISVPVSIFNSKLSSLETIVKFLKENRGLKDKEIADKLNRNVRTIWTTYNNSNKKIPDQLIASKDNKFSIPLSKLCNRKLSVLESIVKFLKNNYNLNFHQIALLLKRDDSTIWTVYNRALKKEHE